MIAALVIGNLVLLAYMATDDPASVLWCAGLLGVGGVLYVVERVNARRRSTTSA